MDAVGFSESAPPLYYALAWVWTQLTGTGEFGLRSLSALAGVATVPVAYLIGIELRGRRAGLMAAALVAVNPMLLWYSQEARAYALFALLCAVSLLYCVRALRPRPPPRLHRLGDRLRRWPSPPTTSPSSRSPPRRSGCCGAAGGEPAGALDRRPRRPAAGAAGDPPDVDRPRRVDRQLLARPPALGDGGDLRHRRDRRHHRPARAPGCRRWCRSRSCSRAWSCSPPAPTGEERRAAGVPLAIAAAAVGIPVLLALASPGKDYVLARNLMPALVPLLVAVAIGVTLRGARRAGPSSAPPCSPTRSASASGPASRRPCSGPTGAPSPPGWANRRRRGRSSPGPSARPRCATTSRPGPSRSPRPTATTGSSTKSTSSPTARRRRRRGR